ncbi:MAG: hypothetical protein FJW66_03575, partial [Actinobacteria bacterium]|nr:hypothetical protein [Actinomycetota bacterium]
MMNFFLKKFAESNSWKNFLGHYLNSSENGKSGKILQCSGTLACDEDIWPFVISLLFRKLDMAAFVLTATSDRAGELARETGPLLNSSDILIYPSAGTGIISKSRQISPEQLSSRLEVLTRISAMRKNNTNPFILFATANSVIDLVPQAGILEKSGFTMRLKQKYGRERIIEKLTAMGYERVSRVFDRGEFSFRGDLLDIFDIASPRPVKIDFSDDIVENIFDYDSGNNAPVENLAGFTVFPCTDYSLWKNSDSGRGSENLTVELGQIMDNSDEMVSIIGFIKENNPDFLFIACDPIEISLKIRSDIDIAGKIMEMEQSEECGADTGEKNKSYSRPEPLKRFIGSDFLESSEILSLRMKLNLTSQKMAYNAAGAGDIFTLDGIKRQKKSMGNSEIFISNLKKDLKNRKTTAISLGNKGRIKKIESMLGDTGVSYKNFSGW